MKRRNLVLDEHLLEEATRLAGKKTYSRTVDLALKELIRKIKANRIFELQGKGWWEGNVAEMRGDIPVSKGLRRRHK